MKKTKNKENLCIYPGSFDPITNGHLNLIERSLHIFDKTVVAVANNPDKNPLFSADERKEMIRIALQNNSRVIVDAFDGLLVDYAKRRNIKTILRGMRAASDFEYEFEMTFMNRKLDREMETIFMTTGLRWFFVHSSGIKAAAIAGADITGLVPDIVCQRLAEKLKK